MALSQWGPQTDRSAPSPAPCRPSPPPSPSSSTLDETLCGWGFLNYDSKERWKRLKMSNGLMIAEDHLKLACCLRYSCSRLYAGGRDELAPASLTRLIRSPQRVCRFSRCASAGGLVFGGGWRGDDCVLGVTTWSPVLALSSASHLLLPQPDHQADSPSQNTTPPGVGAQLHLQQPSGSHAAAEPLLTL